MKRCLLAATVLLLVPLCGRADTIAFDNGSIWQNVRITSFRMNDGKPQFYVEPGTAASPAGLKAGWYSGAQRADFAPPATSATSRALQAASSPYPPIEATVVSLVQADTLRLDSGQKVRLLGVDCPETTDPNRPLEFFGREAFLYTKRKVEGLRVRIEFDERRMDDSGQLLGYVHLPDGTFLNLDLVQNGYGHVWLGAPMSEAWVARFREAETRARQQRVGLWNAGLREAARRNWQIAEPLEGSGSSRSSRPAPPPTSSVYQGPPRTGRRSVTVDVNFSEQPGVVWGPGGPMPGKTTFLEVQPR
jgi:endonuclease YncB( thermonuclease family)